MKQTKSATAGYSGKPLVEKLGIKEGMRVLILSAPKHYLSLIGNLPKDVQIHKEKKRSADFIHFFTTKASELEKKFPTLAKSLTSAGMLWISWPKGTSGVTTDLNENIVRDIGLPTGLVDVKVAAIDETWSGLKFVIRKENR